MQYLVDREFIASDIYRGMAVPMLTHVSPQDFDYLNIHDIVHGSGIAYDPEYGRELIREAMGKAGAALEDGIWHYRGRPIQIRMIGRVEDERRNIADLVRKELERAGFQVSISYRPFAAAVISVYSTDPQSFEWHIYTEGWGRSAPQRYDFGTVNSMNAPWLGNLPGWQEIGYWQYSQPALDEIGKRLFRGEFKSLVERNEMYRRMTQIGLDESVRVWLVTVVNSFPSSGNLKGVTRDLVAGLRSPWTLREAYIPGQSELTVGHLWVWTERTTWNPVGGLGDVYSVDIWRYLHDPPMWNHPFTGIPQPMRMNYLVNTAGPSSKLNVPSDAVLWNSDKDRWDKVGSGVQATSKIVYDYSRYFESKWHHGRSMSMADVFYSIAQGYELAYDRDKTRIEVALGVTSRPYLETFRGFRMLDDNRIEVYVDFWHFEENHIASYATPSGLSMPWEILAAMDDLVFSQRRGAYSDTAASRFNVAWISLVMDRDARLVERTLRQFLKDRSVPEGYFKVGSTSLVDRGAAADRYEAALDWFREKGHLVISNGPYYLQRYDPPAQYAELRAFRDPSYPFKPGDWSFGEAPRVEFQSIQAGEVTVGRAAEIPITVSGPGRLGLRYLFIDPVTRTVVSSGEAKRESSFQSAQQSRFTVVIPADVTKPLFPGLYELTMVAYSDSVAVVSERSIDIDVAR
jgi:peptide/nickel transport system substrate-binding protein